MSMPVCMFRFDDGPLWHGFAHGSTWNGFDNVAVTKETLDAIALWADSQSFSGTSDDNGDCFRSIEVMKESGLYSLGWGFATHIETDAAERLAALHVATLREWLSADEWRKMSNRNAKEWHGAICHSHDFCDANESMAYAFQMIVGREIDADDERDCGLWNAAWQAAMPALSIYSETEGD